MYNPEYIKEFPLDTKIVIATMEYEEVAAQLINWGFTNIWFMFNDNEIYFEKYMSGCEQLGAAYSIKHNIDSGRFFDPKREEAYTERFIHELSKAETFVDVGAELGYYSYIAAKSGVKRIHAYEASKYRYNSLKTVYGDISEMRLYNKAVSDKIGTAVFHQVITDQVAHCGPSPSMDSKVLLSQFFTITNETPDNTVEQFEIETLPLDNLLIEEGQIDVIKMDIEGAEIYAFRGMREILKQGKTKIFLEAHFYQVESLVPGGFEEITDAVKAAGYTIYRTKGMSLMKTDRLFLGRCFLAPPGWKP